MAFSVPESKKSIDQDKFEYQIGAKTYKIDKAKYLNGYQMLAVASGDLAAIYDVFGTVESAAGKAVRSLDVEQVTALIEAWQADSGVSTGESEAS